MAAKLIIYVDVDDTLIRQHGTKRIPIPHVVAQVRKLKEQGAILYCWSAGGADYARESAHEVGLGDVFEAFLPKPDVLLDDRHIATWPVLEVHPNETSVALEVDTLQERWRAARGR